jgi:tRNA pseudouridine synthase 10
MSDGARMNDSEIFDASDKRVSSTIERLKTRDLCDHCLGRLVGKVGHGYSNDERGKFIRMALNFDPLPEGQKCHICENLFEKSDQMAAAVAKKLSEVDYSLFSVGSRYDPTMINREESVWSECGTEFAEPIKAEVNREVGKRAEKLTGKSVDTKNPDVTAIIDVNFFDVELEINPIYVYGRYLKHDRTIPQTRWPCRKCQGKGCEHCGGTGKMYQESVEELIRPAFMEAAGSDETAMHGMGREDIDARMLGNGRPFVLELKKPARRTLDLEHLRKITNDATGGRVEISKLRMSSKEEVRRIKESESEKSYRVVIEFPEDVDSTKLKKAVSSLRQSPIEQRTPNRVSHRRADKIRSRAIIDSELESLEGRRATIRIRAASGTYIKELMHGDEGRTSPSLAALLGTKVSVVQLDVIGIHDESG